MTYQYLTFVTNINGDNFKIEIELYIIRLFLNYNFTKQPRH